MARKKKSLPQVDNVLIVDIAAEGKAIAKINDLVVFVPYVIPGDVVNLQLYRKRRKYAEGRVVSFVEYAANREEPFCEHFGACGGCKWQMLPYTEQLKYKQQQVEDNLTRIGKIDLPPIMPILASAQTQFYRNKLEFTFSNRKWLTKEQIGSDGVIESMNGLGFHIPGMFDKILDIEKCWLQDDISNQIRNFIRQFCFQHDYSFFDIRNHVGLMRNLIVRISSTGEIMLIVIFYDNDVDKQKALLDAIATEFPQVASLLYVVNQKANDTIYDQEVLIWRGNDYINEEMEGLKFKIGAKSFYQTNSQQAYNLYKVARDFAGLQGDELVYDLYTGIGTIANFVAKKAKTVIGIEYVKEAIDDAKINSENNKINNTLFFSGDMKNVLSADFINKHGAPDVIITDPPRAGMHTDVIDAMLYANPQRIVYVSCNPATQARDIALLDGQYKVTKVQPVDMFPHTHHVECVVLLERR